MTREEELLAAIAAAPDDDAARLAHADWLEQHGDPDRAEFIRIQLRMAHQGWVHADDLRTRQLLSAHESQWLYPRPSHANLRWGFARGYPERVIFLSVAAFRATWKEVFTFPVRHVVFSNVKDIGRLAKEPGLSHIHSVEVFSYQEGDGILALLRSPHLGRLHYLRISHTIADDFLIELAGISALSGLRSLLLDKYGGSTPLGEPALQALAGSPHFCGLRELQLQFWHIGPAVRALWQGGLTSLTRLELNHIFLGPGALAELGDGSGLPALQWLELRRSHIGDEGAEALARARAWAGLRELLLSRADITDRGAEVLAGAPHLTRLETLNLSDNRVSDRGAVALATSRHLRSLVSLWLQDNLVGETGVRALGQSHTLVALKKLNLESNPAPPELREAVTARFREGLPPLEDAPEPVASVPAPPVPLIGEADEDGLVRAVWADPFDRVPALVYADWLEERDLDVHAAVLRATAPQSPELLNLLLAELREDAPCQFRLELAEGGLLGVSITPRSLRSKAFQRGGPAWIERHHIVELTTTGSTNDWPAVFASPALANLRGLRIANAQFDVEALRALANSPHLERLASLDLRGIHGLSVVNLVLLFRGSSLQSLCRLRMDGLPMHPRDLQALAEAACAPQLRHLGIGTSWDDVDAIGALVRSPSLDGVVTLALQRQEFSASFVKALVDTPRLSALRNLALAGASLSEGACDVLAGSPLLQRLSRLQVTMSRDTFAGLGRLARAVAATPACRLVLQRTVRGQRLAEELTPLLSPRFSVE